MERTQMDHLHVPGLTTGNKIILLLLCIDQEFFHTHKHLIQQPGIKNVKITFHQVI